MNGDELHTDSRNDGDSKVVEKLLHCGMCNEHTAMNRMDKKPKFLTCLHSFCSGCISKLETQPVEVSNGMTPP